MAETIGIIGTLLIALLFSRREIRELSVDTETKVLSDLARGTFARTSWASKRASEIEPYTYEQLYEITVHSLANDFAGVIADVVWNTSRYLRDCMRIGKLARSEVDVNFLIEKFVHH